MIVRMRDVRRPNAPDDGPYPRKRNDEHIEYSTEHEDLNGAEALRKPSEIHAQNSIGQAEEDPRHKARGQQISWHAPKPQNRNECHHSKKNHRSQIARERKSVERRNMVRDDHPPAEHNGENDPDINTHTN
jgi:hypothetical protein